MLTDQHRKESLSRAYIQAVAGKAGVNCAIMGFDIDYGTDVVLSPIVRSGNRYLQTTFCLHVQAKSTAKFHDCGTHIEYSIESDAYNRLIRTDLGTPLLLVLLCMPTAEADWLAIAHSELRLRHCAYYTVLAGQPNAPVGTKKKIRIPKSNVFDDAALANMMVGLRNGSFP